MLLVVASQGFSQSGDESRPTGAVSAASGEYDLGEDEVIGDLVFTPVDDSFVGDIEVPQVPSPLPDHSVVTNPAATPAPTTAARVAPMTFDATPCDAAQFCPPSIAASQQMWLNAEALLWFPQNRKTPPLLTTGPNDALQFGDPIDSGLAPGIRLEAGRYLKGGMLGIGGRFWTLFGESEDYSISSDDPATIIRRPFFNMTALGGPQPDALIVSGPSPGGPTIGDFNARSDFDALATEVFGRILFGQGSCYRIDLLGGYTYYAIDDSLTLASTTFGIPNQTSFFDSFDAENRFHGGQLGIESVITKGKWSLQSLSKVHLGNMNQRVSIRGSSRQGIFPDPPGPGINFGNGFYAQGQQGDYEVDDFAFVPEMGLKLGYSPRCNVQMTLGYSFLFWSSVALAGEQINPYLDGTALLTDDVAPQAEIYRIVNDGFWMQGIDLGLTIRY